MTVDWEGRDLLDENLDKMISFRERFPQIPILHFLNAAYFTKPYVNKKEILRKVQSVLRPHDEQGLHIHSWKTLTDYSGVKFKTSPSWAQEDPLDVEKSHEDLGHCIPISAYTEDEIIKLIEGSRKILSEHGFSHSKSFRAGGWMASEKVISALIKTGFTLDSSAVPLDLLKDKRKNSLLFNMLKNLWEKTKITDSPYDLSNNSSSGTIREIPNNGCLADYMTGEETFKIFNKVAKKYLENPEKNHYLVTGFHQETANKFLDRLIKGLDLITNEAIQKNLPIRFPDLPLEF